MPETDGSAARAPGEPRGMWTGTGAKRAFVGALVGSSVGLAVGLLLGVLVGWLAFGRASPSPPPATRPQAPAERVDHREGIARLSGRVAELTRAVESLAEESRRHEAAAAARAQSRSAPPRPAAPRPRIEPGVRFHCTFETGTDGWFVARFVPAITGEVARTEKEGEAKVGRGALALSYDREPGRIPLVVRTSTSINRLSLWIRTVNLPADVVIGVGERDDSNYQTAVHIEPDEGWRRFEFDLAAFTLADDSEDENGVLDYHEIRSVAVLEVAGFMGGEGENVLLIDEVIGEYRAGGAAGPAEAGGVEEDRERF